MILVYALIISILASSLFGMLYEVCFVWKRTRNFCAGDPIFHELTFEYLGTFKAFEEIDGRKFVAVTEQGGQYSFHRVTTKRPWWHFWGFRKKVITRDDLNPYLIRYSFVPFGGRFHNWFAMKIHNIVLNDDMCQHDHPWWFVSILLRGGYYEWKPVTYKDQLRFVKNKTWWKMMENCEIRRTESLEKAGDATGYEYRKWYRPGSILIRRPNQLHRLELKKTKCEICAVDSCISGCLPLRQAWSLVFTFLKVRPWGFITKHGWIEWMKYKQESHCE